MSKLKVFSGCSIECKGRLVVGAYSRVDATRQLKSLGCRDASDYYLKQFWSQTQNELELQIATERGIWEAIVEWPETLKDFKNIL